MDEMSVVLKTDTKEQWTSYYKKKSHVRMYPSEWVVRTFLGMNFLKKGMPKPEKSHVILDAFCGDGRNLLFFLQEGYKAHGCEITEEICNLAVQRIKRSYSSSFEVLVGQNHAMPFEDSKFDYVLAANCIYYCDDGLGGGMIDNLKEYSRIIKPGGWLCASIVRTNSTMLRNSERLADGTHIIKNDPLDIRNNSRCWAASSTKEIEETFSAWFSNFDFGSEENDYWGHKVSAFWVACQKKQKGN